MARALSANRGGAAPGRRKGAKRGNGRGNAGKPPQHAPSGIPKGRKSHRKGAVLITPKDQVIRTGTVREPHWALVSAHGGRERWAQSNIERQGMETYLPMCRDWRKDSPTALFPGYIFVRVDRANWHALKGTFGVKGIMLSGDVPARVPTRVLQSLRTLEVDGLVEYPEPEIEKFRAGQKVTVTLGFLSGQVVIYDRLLTGNDRSRVLLDFMGKATEFEVATKALRSAPTEKAPETQAGPGAVAAPIEPVNDVRGPQQSETKKRSTP